MQGLGFSVGFWLVIRIVAILFSLNSIMNFTVVFQTLLLSICLRLLLLLSL